MIIIDCEGFGDLLLREILIWKCVNHANLTKKSVTSVKFAGENSERVTDTQILVANALF